MSCYDTLRQQAVYRHLDYRWSVLGIGGAHLGLAAAPGLIYALLVSLIAPDIFDVSLAAASFVAIGGGASLDAFATVIVPAWPRALAMAAGAAPGLVLLVARQLPVSVREALPLWPMLPLCLGGLVAMAIWQYRRDADALYVGWHWLRSPRHFDAHELPRRAAPPLPIDRGFGP